MDIGFETDQLFKVIWTNEIDASICKLYAEGMSAWHGANCQITNQQSIETISSINILNEARQQIGFQNIFGIIGGPPCPDFSVRGSQMGFNGDRGRLTIIFIERIMELMPAFFVIENVKGIMSPRNQPMLNELIAYLRTRFIVAAPIQVNALDFGVPQHRERVFIIGFNRTHISDEQAAHFLRTTMLQNRPFPNALQTYNWPRNNRCKNKDRETPPPMLCTGPYLIDNENDIPNANEYFALHSSQQKVENTLEGDMSRSSFRRLHRGQFSPTTCYGNNEVHLHPYLHRRLSVREALRLQSVPDAYIFTTKGNYSKKFKLIGNGVPVALGQAIAKSVWQTLDLFMTRSSLK
ncbi:DNA (cytosine-5-)-methyltransferase [Siphonobacter curvatus]|uniref:DNA (cytosine-5-)-methyltransferase n=2 Tax=Siphonobacter curvatus TaxID=2094562 RepID=A0A2S7IHW3_9BACT|nr:DNA (cytosine-5-)-methyltransferase [Siphonobacter curvatus]